MEKNKLMKSYCALIATLAECPSGGPLGVLYAASIGHLTYEEFMIVVELLKKQGHATQVGQMLQVTDKGRGLAAKIEAALKGRES